MANEEEPRKPGQTPEGAGSAPANTPAGQPPAPGRNARPRAGASSSARRSGGNGSRAGGSNRKGSARTSGQRPAASHPTSSGAARPPASPAPAGKNRGKTTAKRAKPATRAKGPTAEIRARARETWDAVSGTAEAAVRGTARTTRRTASILGLRFRKAARRRTLQEIYRALGQLYYEAAKAGKGSGEPASKVRDLTGEADRVNREIAELERREAAARRK